MKFEIYRTGHGLTTAQNLIGSGGGWRWRLRAANGEILASGEEFTTEQACLASIALVVCTTSSTPVVQV